jgi:hypothetical protein
VKVWKPAARSLQWNWSIRNKFDFLKVFEEKEGEVIARLEKKEAIKERIEAAEQAALLQDTDELPADTAYICKLVKILDFDRAENYKKWITVGAALHNTSSSLLQVWIEFSRQSDKFKEGACEKKWSQFKPGCGFGSLVYWAREDNPQKFEEIERVIFKECLAKDDCTTLCEEEQQQIEHLDTASTMSEADTISLPSSVSSVSSVSSASSEKDNTITYENYLRVVTGLDSKRADSKDDWVGNGKGIMYVGERNKFSPMQILTLVDSFSKIKHDRYDAQGVMELVSKGVERHSRQKTLATFIDYLQQDNPELYEEMFNPTLPYEKVKKEFEKKFLKVMRPLCIAEILEDGEIFPWEWERFKKAFLNVYCTVEKKKGKTTITKTVEFVKMWIRDSKMRTYDKFCFCPPPARVPPKAFNRYAGMAAEKSKVKSSGNVTLFLEHLSIMTNNVLAHRQYLINYLADMIQYPGRIPNVAIVFKSTEGAGKNVLLDFIRFLILGVSLSSETANPVYDLFSGFAEGRKQKLMIVINEANALETHKYADRIKDMITSHSYNHCDKFLQPVTLENFARVLSTTNSETPYQITQTDRRFTIFECSIEKVGDSKYFEEWAVYAEDPANARAVYEYLRAVDLSDVNLAKDRPKTEAYLEIQKNTIKTEFRFFEHLISQRLEVKFKNNVIAFKAMDLFHEYTDFIQMAKIPFQSTATKFGMSMTGIMKETTSISKRRANATMIYEINIKELTEWMTSKGYFEAGKYDEITKGTVLFRPEW